MKEANVLNSTEELLNTIRKGGVRQPNEKYLKSDSYSRRKTSLTTRIKHSLTAGVFFESKFVSLVLTGKKSPGAAREIIKWAHIETPDLVDMSSARFPSFLKSTLAEFLGKYKNVSLWTAIDSKDLKLRNFNIPDLQDAKMANAALWGLKKEIDVDLEKEIFDFEFVGITQESGIKKKNVVAVTGDKKQIHFLKHLFATSGYPLSGITAMPFALHNFLRTNTVNPGPVPLVIVNIARYYSEITCLSDKCVLLTRNIRTGAHSLVEELIDTEAPGVKGKDITGILSSDLLRDSTDFNVILPSVDRLLGKIIRTGDYCSNNFASNEPVSKFMFFGEADDCPAFMEYAAEQFSSRIERFSPFEEPTSAPLAIEMPRRANERAGVIPAIGLALSDSNRTPNFLYTYLHKNIRAKYRKMNRVVVAAGIAGLIICAGLWGWFNGQKKEQIHQKTLIETQLAQYTPLVTQQQLSHKITEARKKAGMMQRYARDYIPLAIINEICSLTSEKIAITALESDFTVADKKPDTPAARETKEKKRSVLLKGIVTTDLTDLEPTLTGYVIKLGDSPLFGDIQLTDKEIEKRTNSTVLKFTAHMEIF